MLHKKHKKGKFKLFEPIMKTKMPIHLFGFKRTGLRRGKNQFYKTFLFYNFFFAFFFYYLF